jgi:hypothetical protein
MSALTVHIGAHYMYFQFPSLSTLSLVARRQASQEGKVGQKRSFLYDIIVFVERLSFFASRIFKIQNNIRVYDVGGLLVCPSARSRREPIKTKLQLFFILILNF